MGLSSQGTIFVITGPSGAGKTTLAEALLAKNKNVVKVVTCTTRPIRSGEVDGKDYHFFTKAKFESLLKKNAFFEHAQVYGNYYGSLLSDIDTIIAQGKIVLFVVDVQGAKDIQNKYPFVKIIFVKTPTLEDLRHRLIDRKKDTLEQIEKRLATAQSEMPFEEKCDFVIVNDDLRKATHEILAITTKKR